MLKLKVSESRAWDAIQRIPNATVQAEANTHWRILPDGRPSAQSICWLYCWAHETEGGPKTAAATREVFDAIFERGYVWIEHRLGYEWAKEGRHTDGDIESLFRKVLDRG